MISNQKQFLMTQKAAAKFRDAIAAAEATGPPQGLAPKLHRLTIEGMRAQLLELDQQLKSYEDLKKSPGRKRWTGTIGEMTVILTQARIARGWTQAQLASRLGLHVQQIQDYEARGYDRASLTRVLEVLKALGSSHELTVSLIKMPAGMEAAIEEASTRRPRSRAKTGD